MHKQNNNGKTTIHALKLPFIFIAVFYGTAAWRFSATGNIFYIYNFMYIGTALAIGIFIRGMSSNKKASGSRRITQLLIGIYMLGYLGIIRHENMQIEGFIFYLLEGVFASAVLHYFIAKIAGPLIFGRGWCGWACWTVMVLDFLPWKKSGGRIHRAGIFRYLHFFLSLSLVMYLWITNGKSNLFGNQSTALKWLITGNIFYYTAGIVMAVLFKDNRAFCKYLCPIPVLQKTVSGFSLLKISIDSSKCTDCRICEENCPMDILLLKYKNEGNRILSTECIMCTTCQKVCPSDAIEITSAFDKTCGKEYINHTKGADIGGR